MATAVLGVALISGDFIITKLSLGRAAVFSLVKDKVRNLGNEKV